MKHKIVGSLPYFTFLYTHFAIEHTGGHHKDIATPLDPVSHARGTSIYKATADAWYWTQKRTWDREFKRIRKHSLRSTGKEPSYFALYAYNIMFLYLCGHIALIVAVYAIFGQRGLVFQLWHTVGSVFWLEMVNYLEHVGL